METPNKFKIKEENAIDSPTPNIDWEGEEIGTDQIPLVNDGSGNKVIVRVFDFQLPPIKEEEFPTKEQLLDAHKNRLIAFLWRDELMAVQAFKCVINDDKKGFKIFATCQAKAGSVILESPQLLQQVLHG